MKELLESRKSATLARCAIVAAALSAVWAAADTPARAQEPYKWCADYSRRIGATNCGFTTLEQCRATISGIGGNCYVNPFWRDATDRPRKRRSRQR